MSILWLGDFRCRQLQYWQQMTNNTSIEHVFITQDSANIDWLELTAEYNIRDTAEVTTVIISLGINDCINACTWDAISIDTIAKKYSDTMAKLVKQFNNISFYFCSVNPVDGDYFCSNFESEVITMGALTDTISNFNNKVKISCQEVKWIDCFTYLSSVGFSTRDSVRYTASTCKNILSYVLSSLNLLTKTTFISRTYPEERPPVLIENVSDPESGDGDSEFANTANFWLHTSAGGLNPFPIRNTVPEYSGIGSTLPNCTAYAWGRFYEILGERPKVYTGNAEMWYGASSTIKSDLVAAAKDGTAYDGYKRGGPDDSPELGAIMCWENTAEDGGHVAIVEKINNDGSVDISESGYGWTNRIWRKNTIKKETNGIKWYYGTKYKFQGFIYNPAVTYSGNYIDKSSVTSNNGSLGTSLIKDDYSNVSGISDAMHKNATYIWNYLVHDKKWTPNAVAALLGNMQAESSINPGRYEAYTYNTSSSMYLGSNPTQAEINTYLAEYKRLKGRYPGYGLTQWTSTDINSWSEHKFISWCAERNLNIKDIDSALQRIVWEVDNGVQWYGYPQDMIDYPISFKEFTTSLREPEWLAAAFLLRYEIPGNRYAAVVGRGRNARYWYDKLISSVPSAVLTPSIVNFKVDKRFTTKITASFIATGFTNGIYEVRDKLDAVVDTGKLMPSVDSVVQFDCNNLLPNTEYSLSIRLTLTNETEILEQTIPITTLQDRPESLTSIKLSAADAKFPHKQFSLKVSPTSVKWGFWKKPINGGYSIQLYVNGKLEKAVDSDSIPATINITNYFNYNTKLGDVIQIGINTWVWYNEEKLYDSDYSVCCSNPICMLKNQVTVYLNTD